MITSPVSRYLLPRHELASSGIAQVVSSGGGVPLFRLSAASLCVERCPSFLAAKISPVGLNPATVDILLQSSDQCWQHQSHLPRSWRGLGRICTRISLWHLHSSVTCRLDTKHHDHVAHFRRSLQIFITMPRMTGVHRREEH